MFCLGKAGGFETAITTPVLLLFTVAWNKGFIRRFQFPWREDPTEVYYEFE